MSERHTDQNRELTKSIRAIGEGLDTFTGQAKAAISEIGETVETLKDRVENIEAKAIAPRKVMAGERLIPDGVKSYHGANGVIFELPHTAKVSDVIPEEKQPEISLDRWLHATVAGERCEDKKALEFVRERKELVTTTSGIMLPQEYQSSWIDLIRSQMVLNSAGMSTVVMTAKKQIHSAVATDPAAAWHTEAASINANNPTFVERSLTAQTLVTRCQGSVELAQDSPDFGSQLAAVMTKAMAAELDRVGLVGSGTPPEPHGIVGTSGVGQISNFGSVTNYTALLRGVKTLLQANVPLEIATANAIMSPLAWYQFESLPTGISSDSSQLDRPKALENTNFRVTTQGLDTDDSPQKSTVVMGDFRDLVLGIRREASVEILKLADYGGKLVLDFVGYLRADYLVRRPSSFVTISGLSVAS